MAEFRDSIEIAASPETVFEYLTTNSGMTAWMGQYADLEATAGGRFAVDIAGHPVRGKFLEVSRPYRVVVSWGFAGSVDLPPWCVPGRIHPHRHWIGNAGRSAPFAPARR